MVTWIEILPAATGLLYAAAAVGYATRGEWAWSWMYFCYAGANIGLILAALAGRR